MVTSTGLVGSNGGIEVFDNSHIADDCIAGTTLVLHDNTIVDGNAVAGATVTASASAILKGNTRQNMTHTAITILPRTVTPGSHNVTLASGTTTSVPSGDYADFYAFSNAKVQLSAGTYNFLSFKTEPDVQVECVVRDGDSVVINVKSNLALRDSYKKYSTLYSTPIDEIKTFTNAALFVSEEYNPETKQFTSLKFNKIEGRFLVDSVQKIEIKKVQYYSVNDGIGTQASPITKDITAGLCTVNIGECGFVSVVINQDQFNNTDPAIRDQYVSTFVDNLSLLEYYSIAGEGHQNPATSAPGSALVNHFYVKDHLGSTRMTIDGKNASFTPEEITMYDSYGVMDNSFMAAPTATTREKFTTKEFDQEGDINGAAGIGLFYFGARYYDPDVGVWLSTDPAGQFWNSYKYASNPVKYTDPDGRLFGLFTTGFIVGYLRHGIINGDWGTQAIKSGAWTGVSFNLAADPTSQIQLLSVMQLSQGIANVAQNKAQGFFPNVGQFLMGGVEGWLDFENIHTLGFANKPISHVSGSIRGYAYNRAQGITGDDAELNIKEARKMNYSFGNYLGQGTIVKAASDYVWALEGGNYEIGWDERYKYAKAKRLYAEGGYSNTNSRYLDYIASKGINPSRIEMASWSDKKQGKWNPQFGHGLGGTLFSHEVWHDGFETYGEPYESFNQQDYSDDWGLWQWYKNYW